MTKTRYGMNGYSFAQAANSTLAAVVLRFVLGVVECTGTATRRQQDYHYSAGV